MEKDSKNDKLPPGRVKGTTIMGVVVADAILIAGEERTISAEGDDKGQILSGDHEKIVKINDDFLATFSGYIHEGEKLIKTVRDALIFEVEVSMSLLQRRCKEYMMKWKLERRRNKKNEEYLGEVQVYGWENGKAYIYSVVEDKFEDDSVIFGYGAGWDSALAFLEQHLKKIHETTKKEPTLDEYSRWLSVSLAVSALESHGSRGYDFKGIIWRNLGGKIKKRAFGVKIKKRAYIRKQREHVLKVMRDNFDLLESYFAKMLFLTSHKTSYNIAKENYFKIKFLKGETQEITSCHVLAVGRCGNKENDVIITRVIVFKDAEHQSLVRLHLGDEGTQISHESIVKWHLFQTTEETIASLCKHVNDPDNSF